MGEGADYSSRSKQRSAPTTDSVDYSKKFRVVAQVFKDNRIFV
jgi:hypothetical protein